MSGLLLLKLCFEVPTAQVSHVHHRFFTRDELPPPAPNPAVLGGAFAAVMQVRVWGRGGHVQVRVLGGGGHM